MLLTCLPAPWKLSDATCLNTFNDFLEDGVAPLFFQGFPLQLFFSKQHKTNFEQTSVIHTSLLQSWATFPQMELSFHFPFPIITSSASLCNEKVFCPSASCLGRPVCRLCNTGQAKVMLSCLHVQPTNVLQFALSWSTLSWNPTGGLGEMSVRLNCKCMTHSSGGHAENHKAY